MEHLMKNIGFSTHEIVMKAWDEFLSPYKTNDDAPLENSFEYTDWISTDQAIATSCGSIGDIYFFARFENNELAALTQSYFSKTKNKVKLIDFIERDEEFSLIQFLDSNNFSYFFACPNAEPVVADFMDTEQEIHLCCLAMNPTIRTVKNRGIRSNDKDMLNKLIDCEEIEENVEIFLPAAMALNEDSEEQIDIDEHSFIAATIQDWKMVKNLYTGEDFWEITAKCEDISLTIPVSPNLINDSLLVEGNTIFGYFSCTALFINEDIGCP